MADANAIIPTIFYEQWRADFNAWAEWWRDSHRIAGTDPFTNRSANPDPDACPDCQPEPAANAESDPATD